MKKKKIIVPMSFKQEANEDLIISQRNALLEKVLEKQKSHIK